MSQLLLAAAEILGLPIALEREEEVLSHQEFPRCFGSEAASVVGPELPDTLDLPPLDRVVRG